MHPKKGVAKIAPGRPRGRPGAVDPTRVCMKPRLFSKPTMSLFRAVLTSLTMYRANATVFRTTSVTHPALYMCTFSSRFYSEQSKQDRRPREQTGEKQDEQVDVIDPHLPPWPEGVNPHTGERGGPRGPEPTRYGDWERKGRVSDF